ncbi:hypothetical protein EJ03DRAFT_328354 [Teratosphaeria nubilosa]|uniref:Uncharacterized protein n=1 Tax=Teratosphaeria nubilosa TaxID=161662 RepID=A0A6G1L6U5_9PEZI|nr:hypothetical protein EJ03DRAFT_328354 [Teratosphaeria nubilosa]
MQVKHDKVASKLNILLDFTVPHENKRRQPSLGECCRTKASQGKVGQLQHSQPQQIPRKQTRPKSTISATSCSQSLAAAQPPGRSANLDRERILPSTSLVHSRRRCSKSHVRHPSSMSPDQSRSSANGVSQDHFRASPDRKPVKHGCLIMYDVYLGSLSDEHVVV